MIWGLVLAAGMGRRIGTPKALLTVDGQTFLERATRAMTGGGLGVVVAVVNTEVNQAIPETGSDLRRVLNPDPDGGGMFGSVRLGVLEALRNQAEGVLLLPVDLPLVTSDDVRATRVALAAGAALVVATHGGKWGHPIGMGRAVMDEIAAAPPEATLRDIVRRDRARVVEVPVSEGAILGVNTKEDLERASNRTFR